MLPPRRRAQPTRSARSRRRAGAHGSSIGRPSSTSPSARIVDVARRALGAHGVLYFDVDRQGERALLRAGDGPPSLLSGLRGAPRHRPVQLCARAGPDLLRDGLQTASLEPPLVPGTSEDRLAGGRARASWATSSWAFSWPTAPRSSRSPVKSRGSSTASPSLPQRPSRGPEPPSGARSWTPSSRRSTPSRSGWRRCRSEAEVWELLLRSARHLVALEGAAVLMTDDLDTRYIVEAGHGWSGGVPQTGGGSRRAHLGVPGCCAAPRRPTCSTTWRDTRTGCPCSSSTKVRPGRGPCSRCRSGHGTGLWVPSSSPHSRGAFDATYQARSRDPRQPGSGHSFAHQGPRAAAGVGRARRPHEPLQSPGVQRAARGGDRQRGPPRRAGSHGSRDPRP